MGATIEIQVPETLQSWGFDHEKIQHCVLEWIVLTLFTDERISSGKAAALLGISRIEFLNLLRKRGIAYVDFSAEELDEEFAAVEALKSMSNHP
ncbi:MAG: UPF0175 family protein [Candidatus Competibacteraceae bacterium]|nr:MAG: UPF0175 family protein [Candidatus Competibacteraceae bacterium]